MVMTTENRSVRLSLGAPNEPFADLHHSRMCQVGHCSSYRYTYIFIRTFLYIDI